MKNTLAPVTAALLAMGTIFAAPVTPWQDQDEMMDDAATDQMGDEAASILRGPAVADQGIITFDFRGNFVPIEGRPELAALAHLDIDMQRSEAGRAIANEWTVSVGDHLIDHLDLLKDASDAVRAEDRERAQGIYQEIYRASKASAVRDPLFEPIAALLTDDERAQFQTLLDDYWNAWIDSQLRSPRERADEATRARAQERLSFRLFQFEVQQAYRIALQSHAQRLERIAQAVALTPEQREMVREIVLEYVQETRGEPAEEKRRQATQRIYELLDESQRESLLDYVLWAL